MKLLKEASTEMAGLFVEDGWLAIAVLSVVAVAALLARLAPAFPLATGAVLVCGSAGALLASVLSALRSGPSGRRD